MVTILLELVNLLLVDLLFVGALLLLLIPLFFFKHAAFAVLKRNFVGYFNNPIGYVFLCLFVLATSFAAFWRPEFFSANLANLDQLNLFLPSIMLIFIPTITMSIWSEERRQGTDELLLTLPAADFDIVIGKYLAAASIFTTSLIFSQISNFIVLLSLASGEVDTGLFITTYIGYWLIGLAMISIGMIASFLTRNLTIGFILGLMFNIPLVFMKMADVLPSKVDLPLISNMDISRVVSNWSIASQFDSFGRGLITLSSVVYFVMIMVVGLYLSMALIGARHWYGGRDGHSLLGHYLVRSLALFVIAFGVTAFFSQHDRVRFDFTKGRISSLSPDTERLIEQLDPEHTIYVDAFVSSNVPEQYAKTRKNLVSMLKELQVMARGAIQLNLHQNLEPFSEQAALAEEQHGILRQRVSVRSRGTISDEEVILGAVFRCGLQKVVVPFFDYGIPTEYELIRSINTVAQAQRKRIGIIRTDAQLFGGLAIVNNQLRQLPQQAIVTELEKQYDVEEVELNQPIDSDRYDLLLVVQPSSLLPEGMQYLIAAIEAGVPAAIFEDPWPSLIPGVAGTGRVKVVPGSNQPMPKADIRQLWSLLGITAPGKMGRDGLYEPDLVWQRYNPYPKLRVKGIRDQNVFVRQSEDDESSTLLNADSEITSGLTELYFPFPGAIEPLANSKLKFTKLANTRDPSGTIAFEQFVQYNNKPEMLEAFQLRHESMTIAALIESKGKKEKAEAGKNLPKPDAKQPKDRPIRVVYCADIDLMTPEFLRLRAQPNEDEEDIKWQFENVSFMLNTIDVLAEETDYVDIRKRKPLYASLKVVEERTNAAKDREFVERAKYQIEFDKEVREAEAQASDARDNFNAAINDLQKRQDEGEDISEAQKQEKLQRLQITQVVLNRRLSITKERLEREREREIDRIRRHIDQEIQQIQFKYKFYAVALPWIPPFLVGLIVFVRRRLREREGIEKSRLR